MKTDIEIRKEAWRLLWKRNWFWMLLGASFLLQFCSQAIVTAVNMIIIMLGVFNISAFIEFTSTNHALPKFTPMLAWQFASSTALLFFFSFIMGGITSYGRSILLVRSTEDRDDGWLKAAFSGFRIPLDLAWLSFRIFVVFLSWGVLAALPGAALISATCLNLFGKTPLFAAHTMPTSTGDAVIVATAFSAAAALFMLIYCIPFYRYRYLFRVKADHPDWTAGQCMKSCRELMDGFKWRAFKHDCSYWRILLLALVPLVMTTVALVATMALTDSPPKSLPAIAVMAFGMIAMMGSYLLLLVAGTISAFYIGVGQTILYREISQARQIGQEQEPAT